MSEAGVYRCPSCGAPNDPLAPPACAYCKAPLHPLRCPWCFSWGEAGANDCARCGAKAAPPAEGEAETCPTCLGWELSARVVGAARLAGCGRCGGVWADAVSFQRLCGDRETQAAYLGQGSALPRPRAHDPSTTPVMYRPCARCGELMNRFNFAGCSGVILDACKPHGVWFDAEELARIVEFIRGGGLDMARGKELERLELERKRLERATQDAERVPGMLGAPPLGADHILAARGLLDFLFK